MADVGSALALGTAQLGMAYGVANRTGRPDAAGASRIVGSAWSAGVRYYDTAQSYGDSESVLGRAFGELGIVPDVRVVTKLHPSLESSNDAQIRTSVLESRRALGIQVIWGLMLHREEMLDGWDTRWGPVLGDLREEGLIDSVGVSVYSPDAALRALETEGIDILQVPANAFDRRMRRSGVFARADELGKQVFVRSIYLQGLALMDPGDVDPAIASGPEAVATLRTFCRERGIEPRQFAIDHALCSAPHAILVVGAERAAQVEENCELVRGSARPARDVADWDALWPDDIGQLVDPSQWPRKSEAGRPLDDWPS